MANRGLRARMGSMVGTGLMVLTALTVLLALQEQRDRKVKKVLAVRPEKRSAVPAEHLASWDRWDHPDLKDLLEYPGYQGPRVVPDRRVQRVR